MKTEFLSKNSFTIIKKAIIAAAAFTLAAGCGGGGSGDSSGPAVDPNVYVTSSNPADGAVDIDALTNEIKVTLSQNVDPTAFIKEGTALSALIDARAKLENGDIMGLMNSAGRVITLTEYADLSLDKLISETYSLVARYTDALGTRKEGPVVISRYQFVSEPSTGLSALLIYVKDVPAPFTFSSAELITSGYVNSNILKVEKVTVSGNVVTTERPALGQITVSGREIKFRPINYIDWESSYRITLLKDTPAQVASGTTPAVAAIKGIKDTQGRTLPENFTATFKTKALPKGSITNVSPIGIGANPLKKILATTNMKVDVSSLNSNTVVLNLIERMSNEPGATETRTQIPTTVSFDAVQSQIVISPTVDLGYLLEYEVVIKSGPGGITGSLGSAPGIQLYTADADSYKWKFTTSEPKVLATTPSSLVPVTPEGQTATILVDLNFKVDLSTGANGVTLTDDTSGLNVEYTSALSGDSTIVLTPKAKMKYGNTYSVKVTNALKSKPLIGLYGVHQAPTAIYVDYNYTFTTDTRQLVSYVPSTQGVSENTEIVLSFNFNISDIANLNNHILVDQIVPNGFTKVPVSIELHSANPRTIVIKPSGSYVFETIINVKVLSNLPGADGAMLGYQKDFSMNVRSSNSLSVSSYGPTGSFEDVDAEVYVSFSTPIESATIKSGTRSDGAIRVRDCQGQDLVGRVTADSSRIYFNSNYPMDSFCTHTVVLDPDLRGPKNARVSSSGWSFTTDGLRVTNVYVTYAYGTSVDVEEPIEILFNKELDYVYSSSVQLRKSGSYSTISGSVYSYNNKITFSPYSDLEYGTTYTLTVKNDIEGDDGETMQSDYEVSFTTEDKKLSVYNYGPTGSNVARNSKFWIEFYDDVYDINSMGIRVDGEISPYVSTRSIYNDGWDKFILEPNSSLEANKNYRIEFEWSYGSSSSNSYLPTSYSWSVTTENSVAVGMGMASTTNSDKRITIQGLTAPRNMSQEAFNESCRLDRSCVGRLKPKNYNDYRSMTLLGKSKADIFAPSGNEKIR